MSVDCQLAFSCPHIFADEPVTLSSDRRTLVTRKPIAGVGAVAVTVNDRLTVSASTGLSTAARVEGNRPHPYLITPATTALTVRTRRRTLTYTLAAGYRTATEVATTVNATARGWVRATAVADHLALEDLEERGPTSRLEVTGTAREALGFGGQWGAAGAQPVPRWGLVARAGDDLGELGGYVIRFERPVLGGLRFTATYSVLAAQCLRCRGTGVENDLRFDAAGAVRIVQGADLLYQACLKIVLTELRSNLYYSWYGSGLAAAVGSKSNAGTAAALRQSVTAALTNLQGLQTEQAKYQRVSAEERLFAIDGVQVTQSPVDPTVFLVEASVRNFSSVPIELTIVYTTPGTFALAGTNGLALGNPG